MNVWLAFVYQRHIHHPQVFSWFSSLADAERACLARFTQLSLLRLLTTESVMRREVMSQKEAWAVYDNLMKDDRTAFVEEPAAIEKDFRALTQSLHSSPKLWSDAYIAAFARAGNMTLVTFDQGLSSRVKDAILLRP